MPRVSEAAYRAAKLIVSIYEADNVPWWFREAIHGETGTKNLPSRNKPLAQGKPVKRGAKGKPAKAGVKARKGTRKK